MTREQAIEVLINRYNSGVIRGRTDDEWRLATDTIIVALRDAQARQKGCAMCIGIVRAEKIDMVLAHKEDGGLAGLADISCNYCPSCGRSLEPVGNPDTLATVSKTERVEEEEEK